MHFLEARIDIMKEIVELQSDNGLYMGTYAALGVLTVTMVSFIRKIILNVVNLFKDLVTELVVVLVSLRMPLL